jgi:ribosomal protein S18 acetylase RimI-like enzyme
MNIRHAVINDFSELYKLWQKAGLQVYNQKDEKVRFESMVATNPDLNFVLLNENDEIVGSILGAFDGRSASIHRLAIMPELQHQGYGRQLVKKIEEALKVRGVKKLVAQVHVTNTQVVPFYEKLGFAEMSYVKNYYKEMD